MKVIKIKNKIKNPAYKKVLHQFGMYNTNVNQTFIVPDWFVRDRLTALPDWQKHFQVKEAFDVVKPFNYEEYKKNPEGSILVSRTGGIGDLLFFSAIIKKLNKDFPEAKIYLTTRYEYKNLPELLDCKFTFTSIPLNITNSDIKWVIFGEGMIEEPKYQDWNVYDLLADNFKIPFSDEEKRPQINVEKAIDNFYLKTILKKYPQLNDTNKIKIMLHLHSTSALRQVNFDLFNNTILTKLKDVIGGGNLFIYSANHFAIKEKNLNKKESYIKNNITLISAKNLKQLTTLVSLADYVVSVDTAVAHFAEGLNKHGLILYTNIPAYARSKYYLYMKSVEPDWEDSRFLCKKPCYYHGHHVKDRCPMLPDDYDGPLFPICSNYLFTEKKQKEILNLIKQDLEKINKN